MDAQELRELATNALTGHWPKHLGVSTDAERIEFLARKLEAAAEWVDDPCGECPECEHCHEHGGA